MNIDAYNKLRELMQKSKEVQRIHVDELNNPDQDRTLLYGFTCERETFHVYLKDRQIHRVIYTRDGILNSISNDEVQVDLMAPDKRAYPAACDEQFCLLMHYKGQYVSYTTFEPRENIPFHGKLIEELKAA
jgi:hypothetical protein